MKFRSTRNHSSLVSFHEAIEIGLASDGGLFVPAVWPHFKNREELSELSLPDFAFRILTPFFEADPLQLHLHDICRKTFNFPMPLVKLDDQASVLELFHGPTLAFKDFGARFLALCLDKIPAPNKNPRMVFVATSGDTGGAVAAAFQEFTKTPVVVLYPKNKISARQQKQLTCWGDQVRAFAVRGSFDECQKMAKEAFQLEWWKSRFNLISANSINIGRLLPQMIYFAYTSLQYQKKNRVNAGFIIPSGNVGNATAALWAQKIGFPITKIIFSHNANRVVSNFFQNNQWNVLPVVSTLANAMDVGNPSNFERVLDLYPQLEELKKIAAAYSVTDEQIKKTIATEKSVYCPHTATALFVRHQQAVGDWIVVATAHPAKFETIVEPLINKTVEVPEQLAALLEKKSVFEEINPLLTELSALF